MENRVIETKHELDWYIINEYLDVIENYCIVHKDGTFKKLIKDMQKYVNGKLMPNGNGEVIDLFVTVLQSAGNT